MTVKSNEMKPKGSANTYFRKENMGGRPKGKTYCRLCNSDRIKFIKVIF